MSKADRFNSGKLKWSLVDFKSLEPLVRILEYGAEKYSKSIKLNILSLLQLCQKSGSVITVKIVKELSHEAFVLPVIESRQDNIVCVQDVPNLDQLIRSLYVDHAMSTLEYTLLANKQTKLENIKNHTEKEMDIERKKEIETKKECLIQSMLKKIKGEHFYTDFLHTESQKSFTYRSVKKDVEYVNPKKDYTLTMIITQGNTEVFCVVNATTELDCLMTILSYLKKLSNIYQNLSVNEDMITISGKDNWKKGLDKKEIVESMLRHIFDYLDGNVNDKESGLPHIGHIMANAMFLSYFENNAVHPIEMKGMVNTSDYYNKNSELKSNGFIQDSTI